MTSKLVEGFSSTGWPEKANLESDEPMMPSKVPHYPWQKVGSDLFELIYLTVVD